MLAMSIGTTISTGSPFLSCTIGKVVASYTRDLRFKSGNQLDSFIIFMQEEEIAKFGRE